MKALRKRIESWNWPVASVGRMLSGYLRFCLKTTRWTRHGEAELAEALARGPVIVATWHSRINLGPAALMAFGKPFTAIRDPSPAGRVGGVIQQRFGMDPIPVKKGQANTAVMREILRRAKAGQSIAIAADGPKGPGLQAQSAVIDWARATGLPVFVMANATTRQWRFSTWDRMLLPRPFGRGHMGFALWRETIPRQVGAEEAEALRVELAEALSANQARVDQAVGLEPGA